MSNLQKRIPRKKQYNSLQEKLQDDQLYNQHFPEISNSSDDEDFEISKGEKAQSDQSQPSKDSSKQLSKKKD